MKACFEYKGYLGSAEVSVEDNVLHGKLLYINDVVSYEAQSPQELEQAFKEAVEDYLATCREAGDEPDVPFKGSFNVRVGPEVHRESVLAAEREGLKLNEWVKLACKDRAAKKKNEQHNHLHIHMEKVPEMTSVPVALRSQLNWRSSQNVQTKH